MTQLDVPKPEPSSRPQRQMAPARSAVGSPSGVLAASGLKPSWLLSTLCLAQMGSIAMWLALPPVNAWTLAWIAPVFWLMLVQRERLDDPARDGRRPYLKIYVAGLTFWLAALYWLTLPHWSATFGWLGLSLYLACYVPLFVAICRLAVHQLRVPLFIAAPVVWTGLEVVRAHLGGGFLMAALGHSQYQWIELIQVSDLVGAYGVTFAVMFVAACLAQILPLEGRRPAVWPLVPALVLLAAVLGYGYLRQVDVVADAGASRVGPTIALVQGSIDTEFGGTEEEQIARVRHIYQQHCDLTVQALHEAREQKLDLDLVVWPESMFPAPIVFYDGSRREVPSLDPESVSRRAVESRTYMRMLTRQMGQAMHDMGQAPDALGPTMLLGSDTAHYEREDSRPHYHSTSLLVDGSGELVSHYHKMHPVMFGEYVPLGDYLPMLYGLTPLDGGLTAGEAPVAFRVGETFIAPNICYETVVPHLIRRQVAELTERGEEPEILVTQTNDGWFWGSAALDMHLVCGVFRAVECRKPLLIAANTGISAWIDADGRLVEQCERRQEQVILAQPRLDDRSSLYVRHGDWFGWSCVALAALVVPLGRRCRRACEA